MIGRVIVGYTVRLRDDAVERAVAKFGSEKNLEKLIWHPYWGQLDKVSIADPMGDRMQRFDLQKPSKGKKKKERPVALQIKDWLFALKEYRHTLDKDKCPCKFIGFRIREFIKMWGSECGEHGEPLEDVCWVGRATYNDIENCAVSSDQKKAGVTLDDPLTLWGIAEHHKLQLPYESGVDDERDVLVASELATRLGQLVGVQTYAEFGGGEDEEDYEEEEDDEEDDT